METQLSKLIRRCLKRQGLSRAQFVRKMGYGNLSDGQRKLTSWLRGLGSPNDIQARAIARAATVSLKNVLKAIAADRDLCLRRQQNRRAQDPNFYLVVTVASKSKAYLPLPKEITITDALTLARARARLLGAVCRLDAPWGESYWIDEQGMVKERSRTAG